MNQLGAPETCRPLKLTRIQALVRSVHLEMRRQLVREGIDLLLQLLDVAVLRRLVEFLEMVHDLANDLGKRLAQNKVGSCGGLREWFGYR